MKSHVYKLEASLNDKSGFRFQQLLSVVACALTLALFSTNVHADVVLGSLDYNNQFSGRTQVGAGAVGSAGDIWNGSASFGGFVGTESPSGNTGATAPFGAFELLNPTGVASGVSYQMTFTNDGFGFNSAFDAAASSTQATGAENLFDDYIFVGGADAGEALNFELSGLQMNTDYAVYLYGVGDGANQGAVWTLNGVAQSSVYDGNATIDEGADFVKFDFNSGANTTQSFTATELNGSIAVNGFQIVEVTGVPEPTSLMTLMMAGVIGIVRRKRR